MGKTPKKVAPGGDERNLYVRRLKATTMQKASETSFPERQHESENANRPKLTGVQKRIASGSGKAFKSKLRSPAKTGLNRLPKHSNRLTASKEEKKQAVSLKDMKSKSVEMQPESGEGEVQSKVTVQDQSVQEQNDVANNETKETEEEANPESVVENVEKGESLQSDENNKKESEVSDDKQQSESKGNLNSQENDEKEVNEEPLKEISNEDAELKEETEENEVDLNLVIEDSPSKLQEETSKDKKDLKQNEKTAQPEDVQNGMKDATEESENLQNDSQTDTKSCTMDIVESTTSETSETTESVIPAELEKNKEKPAHAANDETSFVSFDSSIMLKDVQIRLNDCLKDNSKLYDVSNGNHDPSELTSKDASFGKTLRNISGRHSLSRMRHVTLREHRFSPNNSLFVNTSSSASPYTGDYKVLRNQSHLTDTFSYNGSPAERKRKLDTEACTTAKKVKTDSEGTLLDSSLGLLKGLRRPIQVSTPNVGVYKFKPDKLNISEIDSDDDKMIADPSGNAKKWCSIM